MLGLGMAARALRCAARLYRYWRFGVAATGALAALPALPLLAPGALWLALAVITLALFPGLAVALLRRLPLYRRLQASLLLSRASTAAEALLHAPRKRQLFTRLASLGADPLVLDLGAGGGASMRCLPPNVRRVVAVEPNTALHPALRAAAKAADLQLRCVGAYAEALPLRDGEVDAVVATHTLCSVDDPKRALREVARVLRPGGLFIFLEHEAADARADAAAKRAGVTPPGRGALPWLPARAQQRLFEGPWRIATGGCRLTRRTGDAIAALCARDGDSLFEQLEIGRFSLPEDAACFPFIWLMAPHAAGTAVRRGAPGGAAGARAEAEEAAQPAGRPREKRVEQARAAVERRSEIQEAHDAEKERKADTEGRGGVSFGDIAKSAAEVAAVSGAVAVAAATLTAASTPALMRKVYHAASRD